MEYGSESISGLVNVSFKLFTDFSLPKLIMGTTLVDSSVMFSLRVRQSAKSLVQTVERRCRGTRRIALPSVLSGLMTFESSSSLFMQSATFQVV